MWAQFYFNFGVLTASPRETAFFWRLLAALQSLISKQVFTCTSLQTMATRIQRSILLMVDAHKASLLFATVHTLSLLRIGESWECLKAMMQAASLSFVLLVLAYFSSHIPLFWRFYVGCPSIHAIHVCPMLFRYLSFDDHLWRLKVSLDMLVQCQLRVMLAALAFGPTKYRPPSSPTHLA